MSDILIDDDNDIVFNGSDLEITSVDDEVSQRVKITLQSFQGEYFLNTQFGIPYFQRIFQKGTTPDEINGIFKQAILDVEGVVGLKKFSSSFDRANRKFYLSFTILTENGVSEIEVSV